MNNKSYRGIRYPIIEEDENRFMNQIFKKKDQYYQGKKKELI